ncbi:ATP-binding protein [Streptomyces sp. NPDC056149]|uniref:ATP-binding protein n=1 Tax=unclassified Streptomyces TaxID=2593676 RepID=UPI0023818C8F|nr:ATP-binding protein [Streptomyces sp. WZ-12]
MSLPVTRRIARAALLVAAGAAPVVTAAGSASAVDLPPKGNELGGLSTLDSANTSKTLDNTARTGVGVVNATGNEAARTLAPALVKTLGPVVEQAAPVTKDTAHKAGDVARPVVRDGVSTDALAAEVAKRLLDSPDGLLKPAAGLLGGLPLGGR